MREIIERLTPLLPASASRERPCPARSSRTRSAIRWFRSVAASPMVDGVSTILDDAVKPSGESARRDRLEAREHGTARVQHLEVAAADAIALDLLERLHEVGFLLHPVDARHHRAGHAAEAQLVAVELEAAGEAIASAVTGHALLILPKDEVGLALPRHTHGGTVQAHQLPV